MQETRTQVGGEKMLGSVRPAEPAEEAGRKMPEMQQTSRAAPRLEEESLEQGKEKSEKSERRKM